jgi:hypothetical protein
MAISLLHILSAFFCSLLKRRILRNTDTDAARVLLAASYGRMGLIEEAHEAWRELLHVTLAFSIEERRKVLPYKNADEFGRSSKRAQGRARFGRIRPRCAGETSTQFGDAYSFGME